MTCEIADIAKKSWKTIKIFSVHLSFCTHNKKTWGISCFCTWIDNLTIFHRAVAGWGTSSRSVWILWQDWWQRFRLKMQTTSVSTGYITLLSCNTRCWNTHQIICQGKACAFYLFVWKTSVFIFKLRSLVTDFKWVFTGIFVEYSYGTFLYKFN